MAGSSYGARLCSLRLDLKSIEQMHDVRPALHVRLEFCCYIAIISHSSRSLRDLGKAT